MAGNNGGPWGGGSGGGNNGNGGNGGGGGRGPGNGGRGDGPQIPEIDELVKKGQEQLRVLMGGRGGGSRGPFGGGGDGGFKMTRGMWGIAALGAIAAWGFASAYTVAPDEQGVELFLGAYSATTGPGLNIAPWPFVRAEVVPTSTERIEEIGSSRADDGLMLTTDENIVDIDFQVVWNINDPAKFLFNLQSGPATVRAVSESAMREIVAQSELAPILNRDRATIASGARDLIQQTMDSYDSGISIVRVNLAKADPPSEVIDAFRDVQAAEQERDRLQREADAYANQVLAGARGEAAQVLEQAEAYRAQVVNEAAGEASRFSAVLTEYQKAPEVTRKRLYLETMEKVLGQMDKVILDQDAGSQGVVPYLPLNELRSTTGRGN